VDVIGEQLKYMLDVVIERLEGLLGVCYQSSVECISVMWSRFGVWDVGALHQHGKDSVGGSTMVTITLPFSIVFGRLWLINACFKVSLLK